MGAQVVLGSTAIMSSRTYTVVHIAAEMYPLSFGSRPRWYTPGVPATWLEPSKPGSVAVYVDDRTGVLTVDVAKYEASLGDYPANSTEGTD